MPQNLEATEGEWLGKGQTANWQARHLEFKVCFTKLLLEKNNFFSDIKQIIRQYRDLADGS